MKRIATLLVASLLFLGSASVHAKDKDKKEEAAVYEVTAAQAFDLMAAHERLLLAHIQRNIAQQNYEEAKAKIRKANGWPDDVDFSDQQLKFVKPPAPQPAKPEEKKPEEVKPEPKS